MNLIFYRKIIFNAECYFWVNGYVDKQKYLIWYDTYTYEIQECPNHHKKIIALYEFWFVGVIDSYFFENDVS